MKIIEVFISKIADSLLKFVPADLFYQVFFKKMKRFQKQLNPEEYIKFLMILDNDLYSLQGEASIKYGKGIHTKHKHMDFHAFFVKNINSGESVLDIGCGYGALAKSIAEKTGCSKIVAIDISEQNIKKAQEISSNEKIKYVIGDIRNDITPEHFDVVVLSNVLEHLTERVVLLKKLKETVTPSRFLIRVPMFERDWRVPLKKELGIEWRLDKTHETEYSLKEFQNEIQCAGLNICEMVIKWGEIWAVIK
jgi:SAM-dependent methyltransferase